MRADRAHLLLIAMCGCTSDVSYVVLPAIDDSIRSLIVVKEGDGFELTAYHVEQAPTAIDLDETFLIVTVIHYEQTLDELGIASGRLTIAEGNECASIPLPAGDAIFQGGGGVDLEPVAVLTPAIAALSIEVTCPCVDFETAAFEIPDIDGIRSALRYDERRTLLVHNQGMTMVDEQARTELLAAPGIYWAAFEDQQGTFWFGDINGQLWLGDPLGELRQTYTSSATREVVRVAGFVDTERFELLAVSKDRLLQRFDGQQWQVLFAQEDLSNDQDGDLIFLRPGRAVALLPDGNGLIQYDAASPSPVELEDWDPTRLGHLIALEHVEPHGMFVGTRTGRIFLRPTEDSGFMELDDPIAVEERAAVYDLIPFRGGVLEVGRRGFVRQWHPASGFCDPFNLDFQVDLLRIAPVGGSFVVGGISRDPITKGFVIRPVQP